MPKNTTSRPSSVAARGTTCAASCTPCPPIPVMSNSRSMSAPIDRGEAEGHEMVDLVARRCAPLYERVVHPFEREVVHEVRVARVAPGRDDRRPQGLHQFLATGRHLGGEPVAESLAVERE